MKKIVVDIMHYIKADVLTESDMSIDGILERNRLQMIKTKAEIAVI
jgi:hypothetical protein